MTKRHKSDSSDFARYRDIYFHLRKLKRHNQRKIRIFNKKCFLFHFIAFNPATTLSSKETSITVLKFGVKDEEKWNVTIRMKHLGGEPDCGWFIGIFLCELDS